MLWSHVIQFISMLYLFSPRSPVSNIITKSIPPLSVIALLLAGSAHADPAAVLISDSTTVGEPVPCGALDTLEVTKTQVKISATGDCLGSVSGGTPTVKPQGYPVRIAVDSGSSALVHVGDRAVVTLPASVAVTVQPTQPNASAVLESGDVVRYYAPGSGDISGDVDDQFKFKLTDSTPGFAEEWVYVHVTHIQGGGDGCVDGGNLVCKGAHPTYPYSGSQEDTQSTMQPSRIHAWSFVYNDELLRIGPIGLPVKNVAISRTAGSMTGDNLGCEMKPQNNGDSMMIVRPESYNDIYCLLQDGVTYFLNIQNPSSTLGSEYFIGISQG